jgi:HlyD family secretion protein
VKNIVLIGAVALMAAGCRKPAPAPEAEVKPEVQVATAAVQRRTLRETIAVTGTVSPLADRESKVSPLAPGRVTGMYVRVGDQVVKGQVLARLDAGASSGQIAQAQATVRSDEEALKQARLNYTLQVATQSSAIAQAAQNLRAQQVALSKLQAGARPQEVAQAQATVTSAQAALTNAEQNLSRSQTLFSEGLLARKDLEAAQSQLTSAQSQLRSAQEGLSLVRAGNRSQDVQAGRIAVQQAQEQLRAAKAATIQNSVKAQDVQIAIRQLENARGALKSAEAQAAGLTVRAPLSGTVVGRTLNAGEWVDTSGSIATIADLSTVRILLNVPVAQIAAVKLGQLVELSNESAPGKLRVARVTLIGKAVDPATNAIVVEAVAPNGDRELRDDSLIRGRIVIASHNALAVPTDAIVTKDGNTQVFVIGTDAIAHGKTVSTGLQEGLYVEVVGVAPGDKVATTGAYELADGAKVKTAG